MVGEPHAHIVELWEEDVLFCIARTHVFEEGEVCPHTHSDAVHEHDRTVLALCKLGAWTGQMMVVGEKRKGRTGRKGERQRSKSE